MLNLKIEMLSINAGCITTNKVYSRLIKKGQPYNSVKKEKNRVPTEDEYTMKEQKRHSCNSTCSRKFSTVRTLCGHKNSDCKKQHWKTEHDESVGAIYLNFTNLTFCSVFFF